MYFLICSCEICSLLLELVVGNLICKERPEAVERSFNTQNEDYLRKVNDQHWEMVSFAITILKLI